MRLSLLCVLVVCSILSCKPFSTAPFPPDFLDTTSHEFVWHVERLGAGGSYFRDVAVINDTLAYAVGTISAKDSTGQWQDMFNMARGMAVSGISNGSLSTFEAIQ